jgi:hypothetical protein
MNSTYSSTRLGEQRGLSTAAILRWRFGRSPAHSQVTSQAVVPRLGRLLRDRMVPRAYWRLTKGPHAIIGPDSPAKPPSTRRMLRAEGETCQYHPRSFVELLRVALTPKAPAVRTAARSAFRTAPRTGSPKEHFVALVLDIGLARASELLGKLKERVRQLAL